MLLLSQLHSALDNSMQVLLSMYNLLMHSRSLHTMPCNPGGCPQTEHCGGSGGWIFRFWSNGNEGNEAQQVTQHRAQDYMPRPRMSLSDLTRRLPAEVICSLW